MTTTVVRAATIMTMNEADEIIERGSIVIEGNRIKRIGAADVVRGYSTDEVIDASGMVALPGLINGHLHPITALYKGTMIGFGFFLKSPERVSKLIILDTFAFMPGSKKLQWQLLYRLLLRLPLVRSMVQWLIWEIAVQHTDYFVSLAFYDKKLATKELVKRYRELSCREADYHTFTGNGVNRIWEIVERNAFRVRVPTLIVWAENDFLFPVSGGEKLLGAIKGSILRTIPSCGHFLQEERPDEVSSHILDFLGTNKERDTEYHQDVKTEQGSTEKNFVAKGMLWMSRAS